MKKSSSPRHHKLNRTILFYLIPILIAVLASLILVARASTRLSLLSTHFKSFHPPSNPPTMPSYAQELHIASLAVRRAALLTQAVFREKVKGTELKSDRSPVTIGDYGAQALIIAAIQHAFPSDAVVGEEEASSLRDNTTMRDQIWDAVRNTHLKGAAAEKELGGAIRDEEAMLAAIDAGNSAGGAKGRFWALDPIDGTKGFLRGGQYAVCLALIVDGVVEVGVLGCPNLPVDDQAEMSAGIGGAEEEDGARGVLFAAVRGQGASSQPLAEEEGEKYRKSIYMKEPTLAEATFCESVEAGHSSHGDQAEIAKKLGITKPSVRMDSQSKYGSIARGAGDIYLRLPVVKGYEEKIWDHAAGVLIVAEAGGVVTDANGQKLDFSVGRTLKKNGGIVAAPEKLHPEVLKAVREVLDAKK